MKLSKYCPPGGTKGCKIVKKKRDMTCTFKDLAKAREGKLKKKDK